MFGWACTEGCALRARSAKPGPDYVCVVKCIEEGSGECLQRAGDGGIEGLLSFSLCLSLSPSFSLCPSLSVSLSLSLSCSYFSVCDLYVCLSVCLSVSAR